MANETDEPRRDPSDAADNSPSDAPEMQNEAGEQYPHSIDPRLMPGGAHGAAVDPGMSSMHEETLPEDPHRSH